MIENQRLGLSGLDAVAAGQAGPPEIAPAPPYRGACSHRPQVLTSFVRLGGGNGEAGARGSGGGWL